MSEEDPCCNEKPRPVVKTRPDTRVDELSMEDRFGRGYSVTRIGLIETKSRFSRSEIDSYQRAKAGRNGSVGKTGLVAGKNDEFRKCVCGKPGRKG